MRVSALIHFYPPWRNAGSETVAAEMLSAAARAGHEVTVYCTHQTSDRVWRGNLAPTEFGGVTVIRAGNPLLAAKAMARSRPAVVFTHHQHATLAIRTAKQIGAKSVLTIHNDMDVNKRPLQAHPDLVVFNSEWVKESLARFGEPRESVVMRPPLTPDRHIVPRTGDCLTLINLNAHKGSELFYKLAETMPDRKFLGVVGGHGQQVIRRNLPNVTILEHSPDMKRVWSKTRVLLMPSIYESYGLTAVEAGINGIPTIANPTPGLRENLGEGGLFADRDDPSEWEKKLGDLDDPRTYKQASDHARSVAESAMRDTRDALTRWCDWLDAV